jgi:hypothetical protein
MKKIISIFSIIIVLFLAVAACGISGDSQGGNEAAVKQTEMAAYVQQTVIALQIQTEVAKSIMEEAALPEAPTLSATFTPTFTTTPAPTNTLANTLISVTLDTNCRSGPGEDYSRLGFLFTGEKGIVIGWDGVGDYYVIKNPQGGADCWVWSRFAVIEGGTANLMVMQPPPSPTPVKLWNHTWYMKFEGETYSVKITQSGYSITGTIELDNGSTVTISGETNSSQTHVKGTYKITNNKKGTFKWTIDDNYLQFRGESVNEKDKAFAWCGAWNGEALPSPCELQ